MYEKSYKPSINSQNIIYQNSFVSENNVDLKIKSYICTYEMRNQRQPTDGSQNIILNYTFKQ